jgi:hypothetical protein
MDLANYAIISLLVKKEVWGKWAGLLNAR